MIATIPLKNFHSLVLITCLAFVVGCGSSDTSNDITSIQEESSSENVNFDVDDNVGDLSFQSDQIANVFKTGQKQSYNMDGNMVMDKTLKDDGYYQKGVSRNYTRDNVYEIVMDHVTGLMWQDDASVATITKPFITDTNEYSNTSGDTAATYCSELSLGGYEDWRLPSMKELQGIVVDAVYEPSLDSIFENVAHEYYWTSTTYGLSQSYACYVHFGRGFSDFNAKEQNNYVRCVRTEQ